MICALLLLALQDGIDLPVSFEDDVDDAALQAWHDRVDAASAILWKITEGQLYVATSVIEDKSARGRIVIQAGLVGAELLAEKDAMARTLEMGTPAWHVLSCGKPDGLAGRTWALGTVLAHELGHALFDLPDERGQGIDCGPCIMGADPTKLCGPDSHEGGIKLSCKAAITAFTGGRMKFPNPAWKEGTKAPATKFTLVNRGAKDAVAESVPFTKDEQKIVDGFGARALKVKMGFEGDATAGELRRWMRVGQGLDRLLRSITENRWFIATCTVEDNCKEGWIVVEAGSEQKQVLKAGDAMWKPVGDGWRTCGVVPIAGLARYVLASLLKVEEKDGCAACPFNLRVWDGTTRWTLCKACLAQIDAKAVTAPPPAGRLLIVDHANDGQKLFDEMEQALLKAKSLRVTFTSTTYKGALLVAEGDRVRYDIDGVKIRSDGASLTVNGKAVEGAKGLKDSMTRMFARTMAAMSDGPVIREKLKGDVKELVKLSAVALGAKKRTGKREVQELSWTASTPEGDLAVTLLIDAKTKLPVERTVKMGGGTTVESYAVELDGKIGAGEFSLTD